MQPVLRLRFTRWTEQSQRRDGRGKERYSADLPLPASGAMPRVRHEDYRLGRLIGSGGICKVYAATDKRSGSAVCVKTLRKGNRLPRECHMHPRTASRQPTSWELQENGRGFPPNYLHESWRDYLYWDAELES